MQNKAHLGHSPKTTSREDKVIVGEVKSEPVVSARATKKKLNMNISELKIQHRLQPAGFYFTKNNLK